MVKGQDLGWGMGARDQEPKRESPGLGSVFYTNAIPKLIKLVLRQSQVNTFCFSGKRIQNIAPPSFVVVQYLIKSLTVFVLSVQKS